MQAVTPFAMAMTILSPIVWGLVVASAVGDPGLAVIVGTGLAAMASTIPSQSIRTILQERFWLTLEQVAVSQVHTGTMLAGRLVAMMAHATLALPIAAALLVVIYGPPRTVDPAQLAGALIVAVAGLLAIATLVLGFVARRRYRAGMPNAVFPVVVLLTGVFVPVDSLPSWLQPLSRLLAVSWAMEAVRAIEAGRSAWGLIAVGAGVAVLSVAAGALYVARVQDVMRRSPEAYLR